MPTSRRRWFQFGLPGLFFLIALVAVFLGWERHVVEQRAAMLQKLRDARVQVAFLSEYTGQDRRTLTQNGHNEVPLWRRWFGDRAVAFLILPENLSEDAMSATLYFPEAEVAPNATQATHSWTTISQGPPAKARNPALPSAE